MATKGCDKASIDSNVGAIAFEKTILLLGQLKP